MMTRDEITTGIARLEERYGPWTYDIPLPHDVWTRGNRGMPHTRVRRVVQAAADLAGRPLAECRVLDLGCLDGIFSVEFARQGAETVGLEVREDNVEKARFCGEAWGLDRLTFHRDDARNISVEAHGTFDVILCSGLLYHLPGQDACRLVRTMHEMTRRVVIIDTHIALRPVIRIEFDGESYWGADHREHGDDETQETRASRLWSSWDNTTSFWLTRPSLLNLLGRTGFTSVHECLEPAHLNFGRPGIEHRNRCTFVAIRGTPVEIRTSPVVNGLREAWPEGSLSYEPSPPLYRRLLAEVRRWGAKPTPRRQKRFWAQPPKR